MLSQIVYNFEAAHQQGDEPRVQDFVPADAADRTAVAAELVRVDLEYRRKRNLPIRVDTYLTPFPELANNADLLVEVIEAEYRQRQSHGEQPALDTYVRRFSTLAERLAARLSAPTAQSGDTGTSKASRAADLPTVPGYEILSVLGEGGMGIVYQARHQTLNRLVALKMIKGGTQVGPEELQRFRTEAEAVARLQHPNVVQIHEVGTCGGLPFFTLEFCAGGSLARKLNGTPLPAKEAARLAETLSIAMAAAHHKHIIHRDLKPHNVLLTEDGAPKITDFGLAKKLDTGEHQTQTGAIVGTPSYMAPEQARGDLKAVGPLADVYALGAILYEMLTGRPPFKGATALDTVMQVLAEDPVPPRRLQPKVPRDLETIGLKCLHKEPGKRYASAQKVAEDLHRFLAGEPILARPVGGVERGWRWCRRHPARAVLAACLLLLLGVAVGAAWLWQQQQVATLLRQTQADQETLGLLQRSQRLLDQGWQANDLVKLKEANAEAERAVGTAYSGAAHVGVQEQAVAFQEEAKNRFARARKTHDLLDALLGASPDALTYAVHQGKELATLAPPEVNQAYVTAFRRWGLDIDNTPETVALAQLRREPEVVLQEVVAALDRWSLERRLRHHPEETWQRLSQLAEQLDNSAHRRQLRMLLIQTPPPHPASVAGVVSPCPLWPGLAELADGSRWRRLLLVRSQVDPATESVSLLLLLAQGSAARGDRAGAERLLHQALATRPDQVLLLDGLGRLQASQGPSRLGEAIECFRALRAVRPRLGVGLAIMLVLAGRAAEGEAVFRDLIRQQPENASFHFGLGLTLLQQKKLTEQVRAFRQAVVLKPDFTEAHCNLAMSLASLGEVGLAVEEYRAAVRVRPKSIPALYALGNLLAKTGKMPQAEKVLRETIRLAPRHADAHNDLGNVLVAQERLAEAIQEYRVALDLAPQDAKAAQNLGQVLAQSGQRSEAEKVLREAVRRAPNDPAVHNSLGFFHFSQGQLEDAILCYQKALALQADFALALLNLGDALTAQKQFAKAVQSYEKAIASQPNLAKAYNSLGIALLYQGKRTEAIAAYRAAVRVQPDFPEGHYNLGDALFQQGEVIPGLKAHARAIELKPGYAEPYVAMGQAYLHLGRFSEGVAHLKRGYDLLNPNDSRRRLVLPMLEEGRHLVRCEEILPAILKGESQPADNAERIRLARMCLQHKRLPTAAARLYKAALLADPQLADNAAAGVRYCAASAAVLAGCGLGKDAKQLNDQERSDWRQQARNWLRADQVWWTKMLDKDKARASASVQQSLRFWQIDPNLASVREAKSLGQLPDEERQEWQQLWADVAALLERAADKS